MTDVLDNTSHLNSKTYFKIMCKDNKYSTIEEVKKEFKSLEKPCEVSPIAEIFRNEYDEKLILTDFTYAKFFVYVNKDLVKYNDTQKEWYVWNGKCWVVDKIIFHELLGKTNTKLFELAVRESKTNAEKDELMRFAKKYQNDRSRKGMLNCAKSEKEVYTQEQYYDNKSGLYNCKNGTIELTDDVYRFREHRKDDCLTQIVNVVEYIENGECKFFLRILNTIFAGNQEVISYIQRALGYTLTGYTTEDCIFFLYGSGRNGKSTFLDIVKEILGDSYYKKINTESFLLQKNGKGINNDIARLKGSRLVIGSEIESGRRLAESLVKDLTGGDDITARLLFKEYFTYKPQYKIWIYGNHKPEIRGNDLGIRRRIKLIPFTVTIPEDQLMSRDDIMKEIRKELSGILNWILEGFNQYRLIGLKSPVEINRATNEFFEEMDVLKEFIDSDCKTGKNCEVELKGLFNHYKKYCLDVGDQQIKTTKTFAKLLRERNIMVTNNSQHQNKMYCFGIAKRED